ncbi:MAG: hypothetical protein IT162_19610 [Bryobacterales bacterium]|nr:hypothetical protein [Bryobacterales bacterium]
MLGVDLFEPFIAHCRKAAALGDVLGPLDETMRVIRPFTRPGGWIIVSDPYVREGASSHFAGFESYASRKETVRRLTAWGDRLVREVAAPGARRRW